MATIKFEKKFIASLIMIHFQYFFVFFFSKIQLH